MRGLVAPFLNLEINCFKNLFYSTRFYSNYFFIGGINGVTISAGFALHKSYCISCVPAGLTLQMVLVTAELTLWTALQFPMHGQRVWRHRLLLYITDDVTNWPVILTLQTGQWVSRYRQLSNSCEASGSDVTYGVCYSGVDFTSGLGISAGQRAWR